MERNNGRYQYLRRQGQQHHNQSSSSLSSSSSSSLSSTSNNNHNSDNHRNYSSSSSQYSNSTTTPYSSQSTVSREPLTQHDELIRYINEAWNKVNSEGSPKVYCNESDQLKNFKPFNLEEYSGQRLVQSNLINLSHGHQ
ncbi:nuA4 complex subunit EAF3 homolog [Teleopsis dalmanni]|uniref:nuA4 complex subunit EAF3 homolog n=1 Tax=Teleopsis dalmanni TaxID=139649 RepID=UPI0018CD0F7C|nr:nuA4 complex subunit EAF3 homolog [Teleopsis dalmanni]XP_037958782.1 nuA4 complex subunit EAF3 homolog [Teleopsis dalmanni]XP_037958783.1 nuA4 complex subunit EAF3 homolog [Teleopsis dalmanni]